jgi:hypothetical protein
MLLAAPSQWLLLFEAAQPHSQTPLSVLFNCTSQLVKSYRAKFETLNINTDMHYDIAQMYF